MEFIIKRPATEREKLLADEGVNPHFSLGELLIMNHIQEIGDGEPVRIDEITEKVIKNERLDEHDVETIIDQLADKGELYWHSEEKVQLIKL